MTMEQEDKCVPVDLLIEMKILALSILERIKSGNAGEVQDAMEEYSVLVDRFYQANEHLMAPVAGAGDSLFGGQGQKQMH